MNAFTPEWYEQHQARMRTLAVSGSPLRVSEREGVDVSTRGGAAVARLAHNQEVARSIRAPATISSADQSEDDLQKQVAEFLDWALPAPLRFLHIPNGGKRHPAVAALLKAFGVKKGAADVLILGWRNSFIWIELKTRTGTLSKEQKDWRDWCRSIGAPWFLCRSLDDVIEALESLQIRLVARAS